MVLVCTYDGYHIIFILQLKLNAYLFCLSASEIVIFLSKLVLSNCPCLIVSATRARGLAEAWRRRGAGACTRGVRPTDAAA